ncbi:MAG: MarR family transcriptional regulator [Hydrogenibacillus sp.]|nr:MarR family transcriptional regulator [Hydrogenibacillus sp.]
MTDWFFFRHLEGTEARSVTDLARHFGVSASYITNWAERFVQKGLIQRERKADDRRVVLIRMTEAGRETLRAIDAKRRSYMEALLADVTDEELALLIRILERIARRIEEEEWMR